MASTPDQMGPVDYVVVEFPGNRMTGEAFPLLIELVDIGVIRIIDLAFLRKEQDGSVTALGFQDLEAIGLLEFALFEGAGSGLLDDDDLEEVAKALEPNSSAAILVYENAWTASFAAALRRTGGHLIATARIPIQALVAALAAAKTPWPPQEQASRG